MCGRCRPEPGWWGWRHGKPNNRVTANLLKLAAKAFRLDAAPVRGRALKGVEVVELKPGG